MISFAAWAVRSLRDEVWWGSSEGEGEDGEGEGGGVGVGASMVGAFPWDL